MPTKTILHIIDTTGPGGAETVFIQLADLLRSRGWKSVVVIRGPGWVQEELERRGINAHVIPAKGSFAVKFLMRLVRLVKAEKVDVIQSHLLGSNVYAAIAGLISATPVVATYHGMVDVNPNERFRWLKHTAMAKGIKRYVAVSDRLMANIHEQGLLDPARSVVVYNGVAMERYGKNDLQTLRKQLGLNANAVLVGSLGNVRPAKDYPNLIAAGALLLKTHPTLHFVIAGHKKPSLMAKLEQQMADLGVSEHFHFLGFCQDCAEFLGQMDYFALSSSSEGFSIATIEAMATTLPVVVTQCGGPEEIVTNGVSGVIVEKQNPEALAAGLQALLANNELVEQYSQAGYRHVQQTFSMDRMLSAYEALYNQVMP